jgi:hypothetical protein
MHEIRAHIHGNQIYNSKMISYAEEPFDVIYSGSKKQPAGFSPGEKGLSFSRIALKADSPSGARLKAQ